MDLMILAIELTVGRLVLSLPKEDLEQINEMLKKHFGEMVKDAEVQDSSD
jgi:hypothetical protein